MYSARDFGAELKERVLQRQDVELIGNWAHCAYIKHIAEIDDELADLMLILNTMEEGPEFAFTYEELEKIADDLIEGREFVIP